VSRAHGNAEDICNMLLSDCHQLFTWREVQSKGVKIPNNNNSIVINIDYFSVVFYCLKSTPGTQ
jgi:hypothetical protein